MEAAVLCVAGATDPSRIAHPLRAHAQRAPRLSLCFGMSVRCRCRSTLRWVRVRWP